MHNDKTIVIAELAQLRAAIHDTVLQRDQLKYMMACWYSNQPGRRFPFLSELLSLDEKLSTLDSRFKCLWDAQYDLPCQ